MKKYLGAIIFLSVAFLFSQSVTAAGEDSVADSPFIDSQTSTTQTNPTQSSISQNENVQPGSAASTTPAAQATNGTPTSTSVSQNENVQSGGSMPIPMSGAQSTGENYYAAAPSSSSGSGWNLGQLSQFGLPEGTVYGVLSNFLYWILAVFGIVGVIGFIISGLMYLLAAGDSGMTDKAKKAMTASILGVLVGLSGLVVIQAIYWALDGYSAF